MKIFIKITVILFMTILTLQGTSLYEITNYGEIWKSDDGTTWEVLSRVSQSGIVGIVASNINEIYLTDENGNIYYSSDAGVSWNLMGSVNQKGIIGIEYNVVESRLYVMDNNGNFFVSSDSARTFNRESGINQTGISRMTMDKSGNLYAITNNGYVYRKMDNENDFTFLCSIEMENVSGLAVVDSFVYAVDDKGYVYRSVESKGSSIIGAISQTGIISMKYTDDYGFLAVMHNGDLYQSNNAVNWNYIGGASQSGIIDISSGENIMLSLEEGVLLSGIFDNNKVVLKWYCQMGNGSLQYVVYKSEDGEHYSKIGKVKNGTVYIDYDIKSNKKYYYKVIAQGEKNGESNVVSIKVGHIYNKLHVSMNPFKEFLKVDAGKEMIYMYDLTGRIVDVSVDGVIGQNVKSGTYILKADGFLPLTVEKIQ